jgi:hypothetical protein
MAASPPLSAVEAALTYGGDYTITPNGDLAIVQDAPFVPTATIQRVTFLILSNPAVPNQNGIGSSSPDDIFNPSYGSGCRAYVGRSNVTTNLDAIKRNILSALAADPFVAANPRPTVAIIPSANSSQLLVTVAFTAISGQNVTIPDIQLGGGIS